MCTQQQVKNMVQEAFHEDGGLREEIKGDIKNELRTAVLQLLSGFGVTLLVSIVSFSVYVAGIRNDVDQLQEFASSGERFTKTDAQLLKQQIDANSTALSDVARRDDLQRVEETLIRLDERLRNQGI